MAMTNRSLVRLGEVCPHLTSCPVFRNVSSAHLFDDNQDIEMLSETESERREYYKTCFSLPPRKPHGEEDAREELHLEVHLVFTFGVTLFNTKVYTFNCNWSTVDCRFDSNHIFGLNA